ncbi:MAG: hypothetical protein GTO51_08880 [Candidatus Latescibacteria bacterium]|nr:hypothetical protein [Candidatus Latescibacterota bacterium]NIM22065.1 hypothetical protein [Candidatus Latescibacterota bacterium]NIM66084.1 hypothetical protein [Candidatus Latescibacterota bacterium]NIO02492.1 hypothetical protein [Candidatus Latescibacterota bacterium]NIO29403.1 hypothetical protein [Candidatus Latescibacterota bacterium]
MSRTLFNWVRILMMLGFSGAVMASGLRERPDSLLARVQKGSYKVFQRVGEDTIPREIGTETFTKKYFTDNTIVLEIEKEMDFALIGAPSRTLKQKSTLEIEEDSYFPRRYEMRKENGGMEQESGIEMFSNVAIISSRTNKLDEKVTLVLSAGAMFVEGNSISQHALLLHRLDSSITRKRNIMVFDPLLKRESSTVVVYAGEVTEVTDGESKSLKLYKIEKERYPVMQLYVDNSGIVVKASDGVQEFILTGFEDIELQAPSGG